jgi:hypothetical protein
MRTILIIAGILLVSWLVFMSCDRMNMKNDMDNHHKELQEHDGMLNGEYQEDEHIPYGDTIDKQEDGFDKEMEMPYENEKTNQNTNLKKEKDNDEILRNEEEKSLNPADEKDKPKKPNPAKDEPEANANESIVAYASLGDTLFNPAIEAFQLDVFSMPQDDSVIAFKLR